jgi:hypothetical protein
VSAWCFLLPVLKESATMKGKDMLVIAVTAAITFAFALAFWAPARRAVAETAASDKAPAKPVLEVDGVRITLNLEKQKDLAIGDKPVVILTTVNPGNEPVKLTVKLRMQATASVPPMSRMRPMSKDVWSHEVDLMVKVGQTESVKLTADAALAAGTTTFTIASGDKAISAAHVHLPGPNANSPYRFLNLQAPVTMPKPDAVTVPATDPAAKN